MKIAPSAPRAPPSSHRRILPLATNRGPVSIAEMGQDDGRRRFRLCLWVTARLVARGCGLRYISSFADFGWSRPDGVPVGRAKGVSAVTCANKLWARQRSGRAGSHPPESIRARLPAGGG